MKHTDKHDVFTASELVALLSIQRQSLFARRRKHRKMLNKNYGVVQGFARRELPLEWLQNLDHQLSSNGCETVTELLFLKRGAASSINFHLDDQPPATQRKATIIKPLIFRYLAALDNGVFEIEANDQARLLWRMFFGKEPNEKTIRRIAENVMDFGGPEIAPDEAYADGRAGIKHNRLTPRENS